MGFTIMGFRLSKKQEKIFIAAAIVLLAGFIALLFTTPVLADNSDAGGYQSQVTDVLEKFISVIGFIFRAVGIVISVYAVGQMVMAFKNEDADSKSRATTFLVVGIILICLPSIIEWLGLTEMLTNSGNH